jgi:hypothetical protein
VSRPRAAENWSRARSGENPLVASSESAAPRVNGIGIDKIGTASPRFEIEWGV